LNWTATYNAGYGLHFSLHQVEEAQLMVWNIVKYPVLSFTFSFALLIESSRIPADLSECESELVSGYNTEYGGFAYALLATSEYAVMLFASVIYALFMLGGGDIFMIYLKGSLVFSYLILVRATLPRVRYLDLFEYVYTCFFPLLMLWMGLLVGQN
jgi:NADH-quinone oxidoreductase subunit H